MKRTSVWYLSGALVLGLGILAISCSMIAPPAPPPPVATIIPPAVPHVLEGRADCRVCHEAGIGGAPQFPASHVGRPSDVCLTCHVPALADNEVPHLPTMPLPPVETVPTKESATDIYKAKCAACHGVNREGVPGVGPALTPDSLEALSDAEIKYIISDGRTGTSMPPFKRTISPEEIESLLQLIRYTSP